MEDRGAKDKPVMGPQTAKLKGDHLESQGGNGLDMGSDSR